MSVYFIYFY